MANSRFSTDFSQTKALIFYPNDSFNTFSFIFDETHNVVKNFRFGVGPVGLSCISEFY